MAIESTIPRCGDQDYEITQGTMQPLSSPARLASERFFNGLLSLVAALFGRLEIATHMSAIKTICDR